MGAAGALDGVDVRGTGVPFGSLFPRVGTSSVHGIVVPVVVGVVGVVSVVPVVSVGVDSVVVGLVGVVGVVSVVVGGVVSVVAAHADVSGAHESSAAEPDVVAASAAATQRIRRPGCRALGTDVKIDDTVPACIARS